MVVLDFDNTLVWCIHSLLLVKFKDDGCVNVIAFWRKIGNEPLMWLRYYPIIHQMESHIRRRLFPWRRRGRCRVARPLF